MKRDITYIKDAYRIPQAWRDLSLRGDPRNCCCSPLREDNSPSFSVFDDGQRFHDFATGEHGDVLDLVAKVRGCDTAAAIKFAEERLTDWRGGIRIMDTCAAADNRRDCLECR